jgi:hypothetical protein
LLVPVRVFTEAKKHAPLKSISFKEFEVTPLKDSNPE